MSDFQQALRYEAVNATAIAALIESRFRPAGESPQGEDYPRADYQRISGRPTRHYTGDSDLEEERYQINCWAKTQLGAYTLAQAFRAHFDRFRGAMGLTGSHCHVRGMYLDSERDDQASPADGTERGPFRVIQEYAVWWVS